MKESLIIALAVSIVFIVMFACFGYVTKVEYEGKIALEQARCSK